MRESKSRIPGPLEDFALPDTQGSTQVRPKPTRTSRSRRPYGLPADRCTLAEAWRDILQIPRSTFMAKYRSRVGGDFDYWAHELDIRELRDDRGRTIAVHCSRERVEALRDRLRIEILGPIADEPSERATRLNGRARKADSGTLKKTDGRP